MKWISLGRKFAVDNKLHYDDVPKGALLWLKIILKEKKSGFYIRRWETSLVVEMGNKWLKYGIALVAGIPVALCLSVVCCGTSSLPADILEDDWRWMYACGIFSLAAFTLLIFLFPARIKECLPAVVSWVFILYGVVEAVWGIRQVYGFTYSNHSLYALTGSFYNPGPYSGYLA